jgi:hypothetical protein
MFYTQIKDNAFKSMFGLTRAAEKELEKLAVSRSVVHEISSMAEVNGLCPFGY